MTDAPLPVPFGWFQVGFPSDVSPGDVMALQYFGRHLVLWRDEHGDAHLNDAHCPHLGAHIGFGGSVAGDSVACPFHGWRFGADGSNTHIPYSGRTNRSCNLRPYPVIERNGLLMAWFHPDGVDPMWEIPDVPEFADRDSYTEPVHRDFHVSAPWQEMAENGADSAHFGFVHGQEHVPEIDSFETDGAHYRMESTQRWPTANGVVDGHVTAESWGPGFSIVRMVGIIDTVSLGCNTPVTDSSSHLRMNFATRRSDDEAMTRLVTDTFVELLAEQIGEDANVWEHKAYVERPALADTDGPIMQFRAWASQFYA